MNSQKTKGREIIRDGALNYIPDKSKLNLHLWHRLRHRGHTCKLRQRWAYLFRLPNGHIIFRCYKKGKITHSIDLSTISGINAIGDTLFEIQTALAVDIFEAENISERNRWMSCFRSIQDKKFFTFTPFYRLNDPLVAIGETPKNRDRKQCFATNSNKARSFSDEHSKSNKISVHFWPTSRVRHDTFETTRSRSERNSDGGTSCGTSGAPSWGAAEDALSCFASSHSVVFPPQPDGEVADLLVVRISSVLTSDEI